MKKCALGHGFPYCTIHYPANCCCCCSSKSDISKRLLHRRGDFLIRFVALWLLKLSQAQASWAGDGKCTLKFGEKFHFFSRRSPCFALLLFSKLHFLLPIVHLRRLGNFIPEVVSARPGFHSKTSSNRYRAFLIYGRGEGRMLKAWEKNLVAQT